MISSSMHVTVIEVSASDVLWSGGRPIKPTSFTVTAVGRQGVSLTWQAPEQLPVGTLLAIAITPVEQEVAATT